MFYRENNVGYIENIYMLIVLNKFCVVKIYEIVIEMLLDM